MNTGQPSFLKIIRAPFLTSIISPLIIGTLIVCSITSRFEILNFVVVFIMGVCLHVATNVYNDIYDTLQGTDKVNIHRNEFSGGSGVIVDQPELLPAMFKIARYSLIIAFIACVVLFLRVNEGIRIYIIFLYVLSAFFSKYYTAAPVKLAYRGWGEISVWFAFGPMAILIAAVSQNVGFHPAVVVAMPITGISTLSILLIGQMIDLDADRETGKWGVAVRCGNTTTVWIYIIVQLVLCTNIVLLTISYLKHGWPVLVCLLPYVFLLPRIISILLHNTNNTENLKTAARLNVLLHLMFSFLCISGLAFMFIG
ncbi:prenyltransferase [candidate division KSB1 bacterium]|nr:prenyltransferase [candidate division KSB1 bacterium]